MTKIVIVPVDAPPYLTEIDNSLEAMQAIVGGYIEAVALDDGSIGWLNEEGKLKGLPLNSLASMLCQVNHAIHPDDVIVGPFFLTGPADEEGENTDVTQATIDSLVGSPDGHVGR